MTLKNYIFTCIAWCQEKIDLYGENDMFHKRIDTEKIAQDAYEKFIEHGIEITHLLYVGGHKKIVTIYIAFNQHICISKSILNKKDEWRFTNYSIHERPKNLTIDEIIKIIKKAVINITNKIFMQEKMISKIKTIKNT